MQHTASATLRGVSSTGSCGRPDGTLGDGRDGSCKEGGTNGWGSVIDVIVSDRPVDISVFSFPDSLKWYKGNVV